MSNFVQLSAKLRQEIKVIKIKAVKILAIESEKSIRMNFDAGGRPTPWTPRKTVSKRQRGRKLLVISGALKNVSARPDTVNLKVELTTDPRASAYAATHQFGAKIQKPAGTMRFKPGGGFASKKHKRTITKETKAATIEIPARPFMIIPPQDYPRIIRMIQAGIN